MPRQTSPIVKPSPDIEREFIELIPNIKRQIGKYRWPVYGTTTEDVLQDVLMRIYGHVLHRYDPQKCELKRFLAMVTKRLMASAVVSGCTKRDGRKRRVSLDEASLETSEHYVQYDNPKDDYLSRWVLDLLDECYNEAYMRLRDTKNFILEFRTLDTTLMRDIKKGQDNPYPFVCRKLMKDIAKDLTVKFGTSSLTKRAIIYIRNYRKKSVEEATHNRIIDAAKICGSLQWEDLRNVIDIPGPGRDPQAFKTWDNAMQRISFKLIQVAKKYGIHLSDKRISATYYSRKNRKHAYQSYSEWKDQDDRRKK